MAYLKVYKWEKEKFPWHWKVNIIPKYRLLLTRKLLDNFALGTRVRLHQGSWGFYNPSWDEITLPELKSCTFGMICHEIAHAIRYKETRESGHTGEFKHYLIKILVESKGLLEESFQWIREEIRKEEEKEGKKCEQQQRMELRKQNKKAFRKSREYKIARLIKRIKRLESRKKRIETLLKSANRSLNAYQRLAKCSNEIIAESNPKED